jgi:16S rRNA (guanine(527)-N(7))-methyltransferase RsmG
MLAERLRAYEGRLPPLTATQIELLNEHFQLLLKWNKVINLSAVRDEAEIVERHYCESLFLGAQLPAGPHTIVDIGSGAGFPGIPVAILRPDCSVTLVESHQRKAAFLKEGARQLPNLSVESNRVEALGIGFDCAISRAVALVDIWPWIRKRALSGLFLTGELDMTTLPGVDWDPPILLPWGGRRHLQMFHVKHLVS